MTIKEVEQLAGVTKANIRFYEKEGLLFPKRGDNNYREYGEEELRTLEKVKFLRILGIPIASIRALFNGSADLSELMNERLRQIEMEKDELLQAQDMCEQLKHQTGAFLDLDITLLSMKMEFLNKKGGSIMREDKLSRKKQLEPYLTRACQTLPWGVLLINGGKYFGLMVPAEFVVSYLVVTFVLIIALGVVKNID